MPPPPTWEFTRDTQNFRKHDASKNIFCTWLVAFQGSHGPVICIWLSATAYFSNHITKLCKRQAEILTKQDSEFVCTSIQGEAKHRTYKRLKHELENYQTEVTAEAK